MKLADTVELMQSEDFKERFKAEYYQAKIRSGNLRDMLVKYDAGTLAFSPKCSLEILKKQYSVMIDYLYLLEVRAAIEDIEL